ncbi:hypothetical protein [Candidatus Contendibacter odensensis]|uniref:Uncharacterized protein n=1 Tax=Candidatus Contendobacter odensis Run_B_J11 TaxID=1400861 RepID=A0A7U7GGM3_9GAMM|nr:hypothetical protein [Candidatus Contendobacter odensis]CDH47555.1 hypothetical protein BN874_840018 [Candidatus Contendobacter odensis Run_B_J11]
MQTLTDAIQNEAKMINEDWTPVRHDKATPSLFDQLQALNATVTYMFDDELTDHCDYIELANTLSQELICLSTSLGFPATEFLRDA